MFSLKRYMEIGIGLAVFGLTMATNALPYRWNFKLEEIRLLQFAATMALLFGVLKAHSQHKDKFQIFWMIVTSITLIALLYAGLQEVVKHYSLLGSTLAWSIALLVGGLLNIMYNHYVETTIEAAESSTEILQTHQPPTLSAKGPINSFVYG
ncbi:hypothetical protein AWZ03_001914 [Drosophila navojoa]|uniref:MARVEL domain-containing protein n=1 Tax=Drosophila navojoa TaxID=7232 RepID=A0A484BT72_DRONA|nr:uncharacterized protein LOC108655042 isoform X2 [Drosophila navojoa]XP_030246881.1 uncharacterized protein LOC108655042 isoform X2 [Drosophila navojoa]TDG51854.1 hypothetical protein AWZ03_001914 [Drosophila navojoa]